MTTDTIAVIVGEMRKGTPCYSDKVGGGRCINGDECLRCRERLDWADRLAALGDLEKDAARYRKVREGSDFQTYERIRVSHCVSRLQHWNGEKLDAAIDAAMENAK